MFFFRWYLFQFYFSCHTITNKLLCCKSERVRPISLVFIVANSSLKCKICLGHMYINKTQYIGIRTIHTSTYTMLIHFWHFIWFVLNMNTKHTISSHVHINRTDIYAARHIGRNGDTISSRYKTYNTLNVTEKEQKIHIRLASRNAKNVRYDDMMPLTNAPTKKRNQAFHAETHCELRLPCILTPFLKYNSSTLYFQFAYITTGLVFICVWWLYVIHFRFFRPNGMDGWCVVRRHTENLR